MLMLTKFYWGFVSIEYIQPPIHLFGVEGRYAHALFSAASKEKKLDVVEKELKQFQVGIILQQYIY